MDNQQPSINYRSIVKNAIKYPIIIGEVYGIYKVLEEIRIPTNKCYITKWKCINIHTKKEYLYGGHYLHKVEQKVKNKYLKEKQIGLRNYLYRNYKQGALKRKHSFNLSFEEFNNIIAKNCFYCGAFPKEADSTLLIKRGDTHQPSISYNGIDRIDSSLGYSIDNCVACCSICNYMKGKLSQEIFFTHVNKIHEYIINKGSTTIPKGSTSQANGDGNGGLLIEKSKDEDIV